MKIAGIVAEYNPFHNGHALQLAALRAAGARTIVVCLSAGTVQRGSLPVLPESVRVKAALAAGADMVIALPAPYACATAETFAAAGVHLLAVLGCDTLCFGAETPDAQMLLQTAALLKSERFPPLLKQQLAAGLPFAAARSAAAGQLLPGAGELLQSPNNILGIEYAKAILAQKYPMQLFPLPRCGAAHGSSETGEWNGQQTASASFLRGKSWESWRAFVPEGAFELYRQAAENGQFLDEAKFEIAVLSRLRWMNASDFAQIRGVREGLDRRLQAAVRHAATLKELYELLQTKRYPRARLLRLVLDAVLGYCEGEIPPLPAYVHVLGARREALPLLKHCTLPAGTSLADLMRTGAEAEQISILHSQAVDFSALCRRQSAPTGLAKTAKPVVL